MTIRFTNSLLLGCDVVTDELLVEFFEFYADFNFSIHGVSVLSGSAVEKPDPAVPVYMENPLERELNISKNILDGHLLVFQTQCRVAAESLRRTSAAPVSRRDPWGLLSILKTDDQLLLAEDQHRTETEHVLEPSPQDDEVAFSSPQEPPVGVVDVHDIMRDDSEVNTVVDSVTSRSRY